MQKIRKKYRTVQAVGPELTHESEFIGSLSDKSGEPKIRRIHSGVWKLQVKNSQNCQFWPKNGQILVLNGQNSAISEFSRHIEYDFLKEDHKNNFHTKNQEDSQPCLEVKGQKPSKLSILAKKWPNFGHKWPNFGHLRIFPAYTL